MVQLRNTESYIMSERQRLIGHDWDKATYRKLEMLDLFAGKNASLFVLSTALVSGQFDFASKQGTPPRESSASFALDNYDGAGSSLSAQLSIDTETGNVQHDKNFPYRSYSYRLTLGPTS